MEFCEKCHGLMFPKKEGDKQILVCRNCGNKRIVKNNEYKLKEDIKKNPMDDVVIVNKEKDVTMLPKTRIICPKCGNKEAYWWVHQTRSGDESPTRFFKCTKCNHTWRQYH